MRWRRRFATAYGEHAGGATDADGLRELAGRPADVTLRVDFGTQGEAGERAFRSLR